MLTPAGRRIALFFSKSYARVLRRGLDRLDIPPPPNTDDPLVKAWHQLDWALDTLVAQAQIGAPATATKQ
ncbi:MAG: hypothetical protein HY814_07015 [Candidatus Riflebacteria bacterium]|nr:hypothetical protein [Candidatus Riflebacteria bacterium]